MPPDAILPLPERLRLFYDELRSAAPAKDAESALAMIATTLERIEDAHSGVPNSTMPGLARTGRMYPPQDDYITRHFNGCITAITRKHEIYISPAGCITVLVRHAYDISQSEEVRVATEFHKGADI